MRLCLDCGNTRIKWGVHDKQQWLAQGAVATSAPNQLASALPAGLVFDEVVACNVAGPVVASTIESLFDLPVRWNTAQAVQNGVTNGYADPLRLGADRWAALLGARSLHAGPCLVVNAGTATTIDLLTADGRFLGGAILPGLDLMRQSLASNTAQLSAESGHYAAIPCSTADAITSGALHATLGAMERLFHQLQAVAIAEDALPLCLLAGGAAPLLTPHLSLPFREEPLLILNGLAQLAP